MITVVEYDKTQGSHTSSNKPNNTPATNQTQTDNKQITTTKEGKNIKEKNKETLETRKEDFKNDVFKHSQYSNKILNDFFNYWSQIDQSTFKMKWEDSNYFEVNNRLNSWKSKEETWESKKSKSDFVPSHNR